ncbi:MAG: 5'-3'-deoxyribonucleotidase [Thalassobius sp.]|nr:5'-3'-deoxyribonucleotidase [Thalassovita sp.]
MKKIALDMDDVIVDYVSKAVKTYEAEFNTTVDRAAMRGKKVWQIIPEDHAKVVRQFPYRPGFFRDLEIKPKAHDTIKALMEKYEVFIVTAAMEFPSSFIDKYEWVKENLPFFSWKNLVYCGAKNIIDADYLIDDHVKNLSAFTSGEPIVYTAPHNETLEGYRRMNNWDDIAEYFL